MPLFEIVRSHGCFVPDMHSCHCLSKKRTAWTSNHVVVTFERAAAQSTAHWSFIPTRMHTITQVMTMRRAQSTPYNLRTSPSRTPKGNSFASSTGFNGVISPSIGIKRKRGSHFSDSSNSSDDEDTKVTKRIRRALRTGNGSHPTDGEREKSTLRTRRAHRISNREKSTDGDNEIAMKRVRRAHHRGEIVLPSPNRRLLDLPTPCPSKLLRHDFTAGGIPPDDLIGPDIRFLWNHYEQPFVSEDMFDPVLGLWWENVKVLPLPEDEGSFATVAYDEQVQGWSLLLKRYCGRPVSPVHRLEPQEMTYREWEEFARPVGLLLEAVEGVESVYDAVRGK